jgi:hypothetical protein
MSSEKQITFAAHGRGLQVDLEQLIWSRALLQANSGGGKSHALRQLLEETFGRVPQHVIDPEGEFVSLRERFDYVYAASSGGDVAVSVRTAAVLARRLVEIGASAVIDISGLTKPERREFVKRYVTELMSLPRALWKPLLVVLDEAHDFCPEKGHGEAVSTDAVIDLCSQGRKRGFCAVLATQRISKLHKDAAAELNNKLIGRTGLDVDMKRAGDELGLDKDGRAALKALQPGEFFAFGPAISLGVERVRTGKVLTSHPKAGQVSSAPPPPPAKVKAMLQQLADLPQEAEHHEHTLEALEREVRSLRGELARAKSAAPAPAVQRIEVPVITTSDHQTFKGMFEATRSDLERATAKLDNLGSVLSDFARKVPPPPISRVMGVTRADAAPVKSRAPAPRVEGDSTLPRGARDMLTALAQTFLPSLSRGQVAMLAGLKVTGGTFAKYLSILKTGGHVEARGDQLSITESGLAAIGGRPAVPTTTEGIVQMWNEKLPAGARQMLEVLVGEYPNTVARGELATRVGIEASGGTFAKYLSILRTSGLVEGGGELVASDTLFPQRGAA